MSATPEIRSASKVRSEEFEALVGPWVNEMYRAAAAIVGVDDAADVTQEALADAWRGLDRLRDQTRARAWLRVIVVNRAKKQIRAARSRPRLIAVSGPADFESGRVSSDPASRVAERDMLDRAFNRLPADLRVCVALHYSVDWSIPDIAVALGIPEGTVKSRINAGMVRLRAAIAESDR
jgi:RNA polymerase sigma-70 factor (ECF subfamily)